VADENGATLPRDGTRQGELMVRGQWIMEPHSKAEKTALVDCWIPTGSIAPIDAQGAMKIRDHTKDVSGVFS
jgi:fatty-acyl-CoA synthase